MNFRNKRRPVQVKGVVMDSQQIVNEGEGDIVAVYRRPDHTAYYVDKNNNEHELKGQVVSYTARFL